MELQKYCIYQYPQRLLEALLHTSFPEVLLILGQAIFLKNFLPYY